MGQMTIETITVTRPMKVRKAPKSLPFLGWKKPLFLDKIAAADSLP